MVRPREPEPPPPPRDAPTHPAVIKHDGRRWLMKVGTIVYAADDSRLGLDIGKRYRGQAVVMRTAWLVSINGQVVIFTPWTPISPKSGPDE